MHPRHSLSHCLTQPQLESYARGELQGQAAQDCEAHLDVCTDCQGILAQLFEAGNRPAWLSTRSLSHHETVTHVAPIEDSTLRSGQSTEAFAPKRSGALRLWQQIASSIQSQTAVPCGANVR